jgi:paraquat-inducible protein B
MTDPVAHPPKPETTPAPNTALPVAIVVPPSRRPSAIWLVPLVAVIISTMVVVQAWRQRGIPIEIRFERSEGLHAGDALRYRGVDIGRVRSVSLSDDGEAVSVHAYLFRNAMAFSRAGTRFWIVHPQVGFQGVSGLDTVIGPRYIGAEAGNGPAMASHPGLNAAPPPRATSGSRHLTISADVLGGLHPGSPITYRQIPVGTVVSATLASDANVVTIDALIDAPYVDLVRANTVFWNASGIDLAGGIFKGLSVEVDSLQSLLVGGLAFATPNQPGATTADGHHFILARDIPKTWREWQPSIPVGGALLPSGQVAVWPARTRISYQRGGFWKHLEVRDSWATPTPDGWLVLTSACTAPPKAVADTVRFTIADHELATPMSNSTSLITFVAANSGSPLSAATGLHTRAWTEPEDLLLYGNPEFGAMPVARHAQKEDGQLTLTLDTAWHGAVARSVADGAAVALIECLDGKARLVPLKR